MSTPLIVVRPVAITDATLISTDVTEADYAAWNILTTYSLGDRVIVTAQHKIYESAAAGNLGNAPASSPTLWIEVSPTNRWKLFDTSNSTQTAKASSMTYTLRPAQGVNALAALNVTGALSVRVRVTHPTLGSLYDVTTNLASTPSEPGWWQWFFGLRTAPPLMVATDLPGILGCDVIVDFTGTADLAVGVLIVGEQRAIGMGVEQGASVSLRDFSTYTENRFGDMVLSQGAYAKDLRMRVPVPEAQIDDVFEYLTTLRATPCLFIGSRRRRLLTTFGFIQDVPTSMDTFSTSGIDLYIKALT